MTVEPAGLPAATTVRSVALISSIAFALGNFRGPLMRELIDRGVRVYALAPDYDDATRAAVRATGAEPVDFELDRTGLNPLRDVWSLIGLTVLLRRLRPDVTFAFFIKPVIYGSLAAWIARVPRRVAMVAGLGYAFTPDVGRMTAKRRALKAVAAGLYRLAFKVCDRVLLQNDDDRRELIDIGALPAGIITMINGTGVDLDRFSPAPPLLQPVVFVLVARLLREKGVVEYAHAAQALKAAFPAARFLLAGGPDPNPGGLSVAEVEKWVRAGAIEWLGHVDDIPALLASASVFVLPSYREGKPRSTQEAMAMARPVVTTDAPGCRDTVIAGRNGFLVPVRDADALAGAMRRFLEEPVLIADMGTESRRLAQQRFDVHAINDVIAAELGVPARATRPLQNSARTL